MIDKMICRQEATLLDAMQLINKNEKGIAFIIDEENKLCGVLTDGDIRRLIMKGCTLQQKIQDILTGNFVYSRNVEKYNEILNKISKAVKIIPVVDEKLRIVDYIEFSHDIRMPVAAPDLSGNEFKYLVDAFMSTWISSSGKYIEKFENDFAGFCECKYGVAVTNGTVALHLALVALEIQEGDEVIIPDLTFAATINAVLHANATPVIVDIEEESWCMDPKEIERAITPRTKAIIPVHIYGQPCNMGKIMDIAQKNNLLVIEDCAEAHGATFNNRRVGSFGHISCFSFYGNKVITTGEGGMCVTNSKELDDRMRMLKDHGMSKTRKYWHESIGFNYRMTNLQAAVGVAQLERIDEILKEKREIEETYKRELSSVKTVQFQRDDIPLRQKITWLVSILLRDGKRDEHMERLKKEGIDVRPFFYPLSTMPIYEKYVMSNKISREISGMGINLPTVKNLNKAFFSKVISIFRS